MLTVSLVLGIALEICLYVIGPIWRYRKALSLVLMVLTFFWMLTWPFYYGWLALPGVLIAVWRIFNQMRIFQGRLNSSFLREASRRTGLFLIVIEIITVLLVSSEIVVSSSSLLLFACLQLAVSLIILAVTVRNFHRITYHKTTDYISDKDLPSITVAIPARNETADLSSCLQTVIASDYPKLEILVLDDCSQDRTAEVIKSFAHDGVSFIKGAEPKNNWLSKNLAYQSLSEHANGEIILFCGVDVRFGRDAVRSLVTNMLHKQRDMMCVMPLRIGGGVRTAFIQPMRYWWEIALPRRFFNRPPVLSTCWAIRKHTLKKLGDFSAVKNAVIPEGFFARELVKTDKYTFTKADEILDIRTVKSIEDQLETSTRMRYPQVKKRPENVLLLSFIEMCFLLAPFGLAISGFWLGFGLLQALSIVTAGVLVFSHHLIVASTNPANSLVALFNFPMVVTTEIALLYISMYKYEFSKVEWKGRNVCIPVLHTVSQKDFLASNGA